MGKNSTDRSIMRLLKERQEQSIPSMGNFSQLTLNEYKEYLQAEGCSEHMIKNELVDFRNFIETRDASKKDRDVRLASRRKRSLDRDLDPYVEAEIRRIAGVSAPEVLENIYGNINE